jgi:hypothetical protein
MSTWHINMIWILPNLYKWRWIPTSIEHEYDVMWEIHYIYFKNPI